MLETVLQAIVSIPDHQLSHHLLRSCADACRLVYTLKNCPSTTTKSLAEDADSKIQQAFEEIIGSGLTKAAKTQAMIPLRLGGCGIKSCTSNRLPWRLATILNYHKNKGILSAADLVDPPDTKDVLEELATITANNLEPLHSWRLNPTLLLSADPEYSNSHWWANKVHYKCVEEMCHQATGRDIPRLQAQTTGRGSDWMRARPSRPNRTTVPPHLYRLGLKWWLGLRIIPSDTPCPACNVEMDVYGDHLLCCNHNNFSKRHNAIQNILLDALHAARIPHQREVPLSRHNTTLSLQSQLRPADILLPCWSNSRDLAVDITISHPAQKSEMPFTTEKAKAFLRRKEKEKHDKYDSPCRTEGWDFTPLALDSWGSCGPLSTPILHRLITRCANHVPVRYRGQVQDEVRQRISLALMRQVWGQLAPRSTGWM
jgi:hypothetical protein